MVRAMSVGVLTHACTTIRIGTMGGSGGMRGWENVTAVLRIFVCEFQVPIPFFGLSALRGIATKQRKPSSDLSRSGISGLSSTALLEFELTMV